MAICGLFLGLFGLILWTEIVAVLELKLRTVFKLFWIEIADCFWTDLKPKLWTVLG